MSAAKSRIAGSLAVANAKGGVGKTTVAANLAVEAAAGGEVVVAVDLDPQANLATDLGVDDHDEGQNFLAAAMGISSDGLELRETGRDRLWYVPAGMHTARLRDLAFVESGGDPSRLAAMVRQAVAPVAASLGARIIFDTPPTAGSLLADAAAQLAEWLLIPTKTDRNSLNGVPRMIDGLLAQRDGGGGIVKPLGVVLFAVNPKATVINREARADLEAALGGAVPVLDTSIRHADKAQRDAKEIGLVAAEYAELAAVEQIPWHEAMKTGEETVRFAGNAAQLAGDYASLLAEIQQIVGSNGSAPLGQPAEGSSP